MVLKCIYTYVARPSWIRVSFVSANEMEKAEHEYEPNLEWFCIDLESQNENVAFEQILFHLNVVPNTIKQNQV